MRRWIRLAARLYPRSWRERYGAEFQALLDDIRPGWRELIDVAREALIMRLTTDNTYLKLAAALSLAGAILAAGVSFAVPNRYVSSAVLRFTSGEQITQIQQEVFSRASLAELIQRPSLNLYREERQREPMEDIVGQMRHDIRISRLNLKDGGRAMQITFIYPDKEKARAVTSSLVTRMVESNLNVYKHRQMAWRLVVPSVPAPAGENLEVLDPPSLAQRPTEPNRLVITAGGLAAGLLLGLLTACYKLHRGWVLRLAGFAAVGCATGLVVSFLLPETYVSTAVLRITPPAVPEEYLGAMALVPMAEWLPQMEKEVLSRASLTQLIMEPSLDLYRKQRAQQPMEGVVNTMRNRDLHIRRLGQTESFQISFKYGDPKTAQAVVRLLVSKFASQNLDAERNRLRNAHASEAVGRLIDYKMGANLEVLDSPSLPESPIAPNRMVVTLCGLTLGLILGAITLRLARSTQPRPV